MSIFLFLTNSLHSYEVTIVSKEFPSTNRLPQIASEAAGAYHVPHQMLTGHPSASQEVAAKLLKVRTLYLLFLATKIQHSLEVKELHKAIGTLAFCLITLT